VSMFKRKSVPLLCLLCFCALAPAAAQTDARMKEFIASVNKAGTDLAGKPDAQAADICRQLVTTTMDVDAIAKNASKEFSARMSAKQSAAYRDAALRWLVKNCVERNHDNRGEPIKVAGVRQGDSGEKLLATRTDEPAHFVVWHLSAGNRIRATDLDIDGVSVTLTLRDQTKSFLERSNDDLAAAIDTLGR
jgi:ABC-type transporter MlaC component